MSEMQFVRRGIDDLMAELAALEDRVSALESKARNAESAADELDYQSRRIDALQCKSDPRFPAGFSTNDVYIPERDNAKKSDTFDGRCIVPEERVLRWERIERAAKEAVDRLEFAPPGSSSGVARFVLLEALKP